MSLEEVVSEVDRHACDLVEITGGEPLLQSDVYPLMERLVAAGRDVLLETGGHRSIEGVPAGVVTIMDVKCPGSGEAARNDSGNLARLRPHDQVKFVVADRADYEFARDVLQREGLDRRTAAVLFSPVHGVLEPQALSAWVLEDRLPVRVQLQVHKYIWGADARGV
jgi:7-carboxy-7-deazaguanine synthase